MWTVRDPVSAFSAAVSTACRTESLREPQPWVVKGGFVGVAAGVVFMFWAVAFVCEEYCVPAIVLLCRRHRISDHAMGAIFIGTGLSLPVLFASFAGIFYSNSAIGVGTVVGGSAFNHLVNFAVSIYVAPHRTLKLNGFVFSRESLFYLLSCVAVIWATERNLEKSFLGMFDRSEWVGCLSIDWRSSMVLVLGYLFYLLIGMYSEEAMAALARWRGTPAGTRPLSLASDLDTVDDLALGAFQVAVEGEILYDVTELVAVNSPSERVLGRGSSAQELLPQELLLQELPVHAEGRTVLLGNYSWSTRAGCLSRAVVLATLPLRVAIAWTVPDARAAGQEQAAVRSILASFGWLALFTFLLIAGLEELASVLRINSAVVGLTVGAWAASYPALWSSVVVARSGLGDVAVCNALGSIVFSNLVGLGLPWLVHDLAASGHLTQLEDEGVVLSLAGLMAVALGCYLLVAINAWTLKPWMAPLFLGVYAGYVVMLIYFSVTLPARP